MTISDTELLIKHRSAMTALRIVYDNDGLFDWGNPNGDGPEMLHRLVDQYADAGARAIVWGCGNNLAWSYTPKVQEAWCDRARVEAFGQVLVDRQRQWLEAGTDPLAVVLERAQVRQLPVLAGFRINRFFQAHGVESWFEKNPHVVLSAASCPFYPDQMSVNLALPEVREHFVEGSIDVVERYEVEGLHLEFMRAIPFFERDEPDKVEHVNTFLRMLRKELDRIGQRRGRRVKLSIWTGTPENYRVIRKGLFPPEFCDLSFHGIDPQTWMAEGLVDILMVSVWSAPEGRRGQPVDMAPWMEMARGTGTTILGEIDNATALPDPEHLREAEGVIRLTSETSDGVYLFNTGPYELAFLLEHAAKSYEMRRCET
jgi:hypothetical protein